jgi:hypothetical protein
MSFDAQIHTPICTRIGTEKKRQKAKQPSHAFTCPRAIASLLLTWLRSQWSPELVTGTIQAHSPYPRCLQTAGTTHAPSLSLAVPHPGKVRLAPPAAGLRASAVGSAVVVVQVWPQKRQ